MVFPIYYFHFFMPGSCCPRLNKPPDAPWRHMAGVMAKKCIHPTEPKVNIQKKAKSIKKIWVYSLARIK